MSVLAPQVPYHFGRVNISLAEINRFCAMVNTFNECSRIYHLGGAVGAYDHRFCMTLLALIPTTYGDMYDYTLVVMLNADLHHYRNLFSNSHK